MITIRHPEAALRRKPRIAPEALAHLRKVVYGYTHRRAAEMLGLSPESYRRYERDRIPSGPAALILEIWALKPHLLDRYGVPRVFRPGLIVDLRVRQLEMSQSVFANLLNVTPDTVGKWEQGLRRPSRAAAILMEMLANGRARDLQDLSDEVRGEINVADLAPREVPKSPVARFPLARKAAAKKRPAIGGRREPVEREQLSLF